MMPTNINMLFARAECLFLSNHGKWISLSVGVYWQNINVYPQEHQLVAKKLNGVVSRLLLFLFVVCCADNC